MKNTDYWQNRFKQLEKAQYNTSAEQIQSIYELFTKSERVIQNKINNWCMRFADNNNITYAEALKLLKNDELNELKWDVNQYIAHGQENSINQKWLKELENASSKVHISYLQSIQLQCRMEIEKLYAEYDDLLDKTVKNAYEERYYKTAYEIQLGTQSGKFLSGLDTDLVNDIIHKPWALDEKNFSERIWNDKTKLINTLHNSLTRMCIVGEGPEKAVKEVADKMHVSRQQAAKVVNTEVAAFTAKAQQDCFKELDIEQFEVVETLDSHTCKRCADMDGKHFTMNQYKIGITVPPFHPNCRGCTAPYFDDEFNHTGKRAASDDTGKIYYVPADMSYKEWKKLFVNGGEKFDETESLKQVVKDMKATLSGKEAEAVRHIEKNLAIKTGIPIDKVEMTGLQYDTAKMIYDSYDIVLKKFPELKGQLESFKYNSGFKGKSYAGCVTYTGKIKVYGKFADYDRLVKLYANDVAKGFHPVGTDHRSIIVHELGHALDGYMSNHGLLDGNDNRTTSKTVKDMTLKLAGFDKQKLEEDLIKQGLSSHKISDILDKKERDFIAEHVSVYATGYNSKGSASTKFPEREFFAECFVEYMMSDNPRKVAKIFGEIIETALGG